MLSYHLFLCSYLILYYLIFSSLVKNYWPTDFHPSEPNTTIRGSNHRHRHHVEPICTRNIDLGPGASKNTGKTHRGAFLVFVLGATSWKSMRKSPTWYITYLSACRTMNSYDVWFYSTHVPQELHGEGNEGTVFFWCLRSIVNTEFGTTCHECFLILPSLALKMLMVQNPKQPSFGCTKPFK